MKADESLPFCCVNGLPGLGLNKQDKVSWAGEGARGRGADMKNVASCGSRRIPSVLGSGDSGGS